MNKEIWINWSRDCFSKTLLSNMGRICKVDNDTRDKLFKNVFNFLNKCNDTAGRITTIDKFPKNYRGLIKCKGTEFKVNFYEAHELGLIDELDYSSVELDNDLKNIVEHFDSMALITNYLKHTDIQFVYRYNDTNECLTINNHITIIYYYDMDEFMIFTNNRIPSLQHFSKTEEKVIELLDKLLNK